MVAGVEKVSKVSKIKPIRSYFSSILKARKLQWGENRDIYDPNPRPGQYEFEFGDISRSSDKQTVEETLPLKFTFFHCAKKSHIDALDAAISTASLIANDAERIQQYPLPLKNVECTSIEHDPISKGNDRIIKVEISFQLSITTQQEY